MNPFTTTLQKGIIIGLLAVVLVLGGTAGWQWWRAERLENKLGACENAKAGLVGALDTQNTAVKGWQEAASTAQAVSSKALATARAANAVKAPEIKRLAEAVAAGRATDCAAAMSTIREGLR